MQVQLAMHKFILLEKIIQKRIGSLRDRKSHKCTVRYIAGRRDELQFLQWTTTIVKSILDRVDEQREEIGIIKHRKELIGIVEFARLPQ